MSPHQWELIGGSAGLLVLAGALVVFEFVVVSWGVLTLAAAACVFGGWSMAHAASPTAGWIFLGASPVIALIALRMGMIWLRAAGAVVTAAITSDAGYHHLASSIGVARGARGELVTDAMPTGRARFAGGEADVQVEGPVLQRGSQVTVLRIEGALVIVADGRAAALPATAPAPVPSTAAPR